jgi:hypothetical protein
MPYYRGKSYGPEAWVLLLAAAGPAILLATALLRHATATP